MTYTDEEKAKIKKSIEEMITWINENADKDIRIMDEFCAPNGDTVHFEYSAVLSNTHSINMDYQHYFYDGLGFVNWDRLVGYMEAWSSIQERIFNANNKIAKTRECIKKFHV